MRLSEIPIPKDSKFIERDSKGEKVFRYRIGEYRTLYKVKDADQAILIVKIDKRTKVY